MTGWINSCRTAAGDALVWCRSNVGSWFLACILRTEEEEERTVNKSYCHRLYLSEFKNCMQIFSVSASADAVNVARYFVISNRPRKVESGSLRTHFIRRKNIFFTAHTHSRIYDA